MPDSSVGHIGGSESLLGLDPRMALIGVKYNGRVTAALVLTGATEEEIREFHESMAETDRDVELVTVEDARKRLEL